MEWQDYLAELKRISPLSPQRERELWIAYKEQGDRAARSLLIRSYQPLVFRCARPFASMDGVMDVVQEGTVGLIEAAESYDHCRGVAFSLFAVHRIRGRMMDWLAAEAKRGELLTDFLADDGDLRGWEAIPDVGEGIPEQLEKAELHSRLQTAVNRLPEKERRVISSLYLEEETAGEVAETMAMSVGSIYRLQKKGIQRIRGMLSRFMAK
ncbi:MAG: sigma-70 family RNA polymerase sigma factor [Selenomonadaceae bacterium]|nr:sigma-70 family RNA polymerase sigma factor [Selenomonadaceae bacterium]